MAASPPGNFEFQQRVCYKELRPYIFASCSWSQVVNQLGYYILTLESNSKTKLSIKVTRKSQKELPERFVELTKENKYRFCFDFEVETDEKKITLEIKKSISNRGTVIFANLYRCNLKSIGFSIFDLRNPYRLECWLKANENPNAIPSFSMSDTFKFLSQDVPHEKLVSEVRTLQSTHNNATLLHAVAFLSENAQTRPVIDCLFKYQANARLLCEEDTAADLARSTNKPASLVEVLKGKGKFEIKNNTLYKVLIEYRAKGSQELTGSKNDLLKALEDCNALAYWVKCENQRTKEIGMFPRWCLVVAGDTLVSPSRFAIHPTPARGNPPNQRNFKQNSIKQRISSTLPSEPPTAAILFHGDSHLMFSTTNDYYQYRNLVSQNRSNAEAESFLHSLASKGQLRRVLVPACDVYAIRDLSYIATDLGVVASDLLYHPYRIISDFQDHNQHIILKKGELVYGYPTEKSDSSESWLRIKLSQPSPSNQNQITFGFIPSSCCRMLSEDSKPPTDKLSKSEIDHIIKNEDHSTCTICFGEMYAQPIGVFVSAFHKRSCRHFFHFQCILTLTELESSRHLCPICRIPFDNVALVPDFNEDPLDWFKLLDVDENGALSLAEVNDICNATLPIRIDSLEKYLQEHWLYWTQGKDLITYSDLSRKDGLFPFIRKKIASSGFNSQIPTLKADSRSKTDWFEFFDKDLLGRVSKDDIFQGLVKTYGLESELDSAKHQFEGIWEIFFPDSNVTTCELNAFIEPGNLGDCLILKFTTQTDQSYSGVLPPNKL